MYVNHYDYLYLFLEKHLLYIYMLVSEVDCCNNNKTFSHQHIIKVEKCISDQMNAFTLCLTAQ